MTHVTPDTIDPAIGEKLADQLAPQNFVTLDFDQLRAWLSAASARLAAQVQLDLQQTEQTRTLRDELRSLRDDYRSRIVGMLKAIAIADRAHANDGSFAALLDSLDAMSADELIRTYRRTSAIFRDHFPGNYTQPLNRKSV